MKPNDFEAELQARTPRQLPPDWRAEILSAAVSAGSDSTSRLPQNREGRMTPVMWRWGSLAAIWTLIGLLNLSAPEAEVGGVQASRVAAADWEQHWQEQRRMLADLLQQPAAPTEPRRREIPPPRPRSGARPGDQKAHRLA